MRNSSDLPPQQPHRSSSGGFRIAKPGRSRVIASVLIGALVALFISGKSIASFYVDVLWFDALDKTNIYWSILGTKALLGAIFVAAFALILIVNMWIADRMAPDFIPPSQEERALAAYRQLVGKRQWLLRVVVGIILGLIVGLPVMSQWQDWMLFVNQQAFGIKESLFNQDVSFYVFRLPLLGFIVNWLFGAFVLITLVTAAMHYLNGGIRLQNLGNKVTPAAKAHLSVMLAVLALVRAAGYWLSRFDLLGSTRGVVQGATYTDVNAQLPAINLMVLVSIAVALLFLYNVRLKGWRIPVMATLMWMVVAIAAGTIYPALVQRFSVQPDVSTKELPYIATNLQATKHAMNLTDIVHEPLSFGSLNASDVTANDAQLKDVRQLDPSEMRDRFALDEGKTSFYTINDLDVDRYAIDGRLQQVVLGARELNSAGIPNRTWVSRHLIYTHGCGVVAAPASRVTTDGRPTYVDLGVTRPQLYVGEGLNDYAIVGTKQVEQACPDLKPEAYSSIGGVALSSTMRRAAFAVHFGEYNLFGSGLITPESRLMWVRNIKDRVAKIAPFFRYDADPYPAVVGGKVVWILDAFTTTSRYPNAQSANISQLTPGSGLNATFNYVRNSVKAVVDAYSGEITLYLVDPNDPIAATWAKAFPNLLTPVSKASSELVSHFRYPEDLFRVQTNVYGRYQFDDATLFFNRDGAWSVAQAPSTAVDATNGGVGASGAVLSPDQIDVQDANVARFEPYYTMFHAPGSTDLNGTFSLLRPFVPFSSDDTRKELRAFMVVSSDPKSYGKITVYEVNNPLPEGPATVAAEFGSDPTVSQQVTLLDQRGSRVVFGDLQIVPVGRGLVYLRPLYVRPDDANARQVFVRKFLAFYNNKVVIADDLTAAVAKLFPGYTGNLGDRINDGSVTTPTDTSNTSNTSPTGSATTVPATAGSTGTLTAAQQLAQAEILFDEADAALAATPPDFSTYQSKLAQARELVRLALAQVSG